jgi:endonuclease YncB( thermonuclease family)
MAVAKTWPALIAAALMGLALPTPAHADVVGVASVIDADTIEIHGERIRLYGIDAPESCQTCIDASGRTCRCGQRAALALQNLIGRRTVSCQQRDVDRYGRIVAQCQQGDIDIGEWLVGQGLALAYRRYSKAYVAAEETASAAKRGVWAGSFTAPWDWRREHGSCGRVEVLMPPEGPRSLASTLREVGLETGR